MAIDQEREGMNDVAPPGVATELPEKEGVGDEAPVEAAMYDEPAGPELPPEDYKSAEGLRALNDDEPLTQSQQAYADRIDAAIDKDKKIKARAKYIAEMRYEQRTAEMNENIKRMKLTQQTYKQDMLKNSQKMKELNKMGISPGRVFDNMANWKKVLLVLGSGVGGYAASMSGQKNSVLEEIDNIINRDITEQTRKLKAGMGLLSMERKDISENLKNQMTLLSFQSKMSNERYSAVMAQVRSIRDSATNLKDIERQTKALKMLQLKSAKKNSKNAVAAADLRAKQLKYMQELRKQEAENVSYTYNGKTFSKRYSDGQHAEKTRTAYKNLINKAEKYRDYISLFKRLKNLSATQRGIGKIDQKTHNLITTFVQSAKALSLFDVPKGLAPISNEERALLAELEGLKAGKTGLRSAFSEYFKGTAKAEYVSFDRRKKLMFAGDVRSIMPEGFKKDFMSKLNQSDGLTKALGLFQNFSVAEQDAGREITDAEVLEGLPEDAREHLKPVSQRATRQQLTLLRNYLNGGRTLTQAEVNALPENYREQYLKHRQQKGRK